MDRQYKDQKKHGTTIQRPKETWTGYTKTTRNMDVFSVRFDVFSVRFVVLSAKFVVFSVRFVVFSVGFTVYF
jgi:(p)ppGpp synthase/HD superfamily hydrolase